MERPFRISVLVVAAVALFAITLPVTAQDGYPITTPTVTPTPTKTRTPWLETGIPAPRTPTPTPNPLLPPCHYVYLPMIVRPDDGTTPVPTATPSAAQPRPFCESGFYVLSSGDKMTIPNVVTYGDIARVLAVSGLIVTVILMSLIRVPKLWLH